MTTPSIPTAAPWRARPVVSCSSDWRDWSPQSIWRDGHSIILNLLDPRGLIPAPVPFAIGRWKAPDYDLSFEMELAINVHKPTILPMMLLVSRTVSTLLQFTCVIPMRTGEIWQGGIPKIMLYFHDFLYGEEIYHFHWGLPRAVNVVQIQLCLSSVYISQFTSHV